MSFGPDSNISLVRSELEPKFKLDQAWSQVDLIRSTIWARTSPPSPYPSPWAVPYCPSRSRSLSWLPPSAKMLSFYTRAGSSLGFADTLARLRFSILMPEIASPISLVAMLRDELGRRVLCPMLTIIDYKNISYHL